MALVFAGLKFLVVFGWVSLLWFLLSFSSASMVSKTNSVLGPGVKVAWFADDEGMDFSRLFSSEVWELREISGLNGDFFLLT